MAYAPKLTSSNKQDKRQDNIKSHVQRYKVLFVRGRSKIDKNMSIFLKKNTKKNTKKDKNMSTMASFLPTKILFFFFFFDMSTQG
jgi:predicted transcriptional regulator